MSAFADLQRTHRVLEGVRHFRDLPTVQTTASHAYHVAQRHHDVNRAILTILTERTTTQKLLEYIEDKAKARQSPSARSRCCSACCMRAKSWRMLPRSSSAAFRRARSSALASEAAAGSSAVNQGQSAQSSDAPTSINSANANVPPASIEVSMKSTSSFKVLTECPLIVMLLFQLYPEHVRKHVKIFIPLMISALKLAPPNVSPDTPMPPIVRARFSEMVACQVKTLSFLTYLLKGFRQQMQPYEKVIATAVVELLQRCPVKAVSTRKELLVATRHILATDFRKGLQRFPASSWFMSTLRFYQN